MRTVLFVAPFLLDATLKFVQAAAAVPNVRLVVITQDEPGKVPPGASHWKVSDATRTETIVEAARQIMARTGGAHCILGILENIQDQLAEARVILGLPGITPEVARRFRDKGVMKTVLREAGLPCARHARIRFPQDAWQFIAQVGYPIVIKPPDGAGCRATYQVNSAEDLNVALAEIQPTPEREALAEEFVTGEEHSFDTLTLNGKALFHNIGRYLPGPLDVMRNDWIQWCVYLPRDISGPEFDPIRKVGFAANTALGLGTAMTHMEWFRRADGSAVISEVGARPPGAQFTSLMSWAYDRSLYAAWAHLMIDGKVEGPFERKYSAGVAFFRGVGTGRVSRVENLDLAQRKVGHLVVEAKLPVIGRPRASGYEGEGFAIVRHPDTRVVTDALSTLIQTVRVHYE
jgi:formate-dependent phosphoribosylglycinamide formyltransferase (GAR transformylase)